MEKCQLCKKESEDIETCERCGKEVCFNCIYDYYPYNTSLCVECGNEWKILMEDNNFIC